uniref:Tumor necrosis factor alpha-induced protein 2-like n=2 Tax=Cyprinodon variegatus TaxID=28743 RepID=A0A3Q2CET8_CYPVA
MLQGFFFMRIPTDIEMGVGSDSERSKMSNVMNKTGRSMGVWIRGKFQKIKRPSNPQEGINTSPLMDEPQSLFVTDSSTAIQTFEQLYDAEYLFEASLVLIDRENQLLGKKPEEEAQQMEKITADRKVLEKKLLRTIQRSLSLSFEQVQDKAAVSALTMVLTSAVKAIYQEEEQDLLRKQERRGTLSNWKTLHDSTLHSLVEDRMDNPSVPIADLTGQSSIQLDIHGMGRQLKEDLLIVVNVLKSCYPLDANICQFYARLYHQSLSARLRKIVDYVLDDKDCTFILRWVNEYYPGILKNPELANEIDTTALGKLLPDEFLDNLEKQYLATQQSELSTCMDRVLEEEKRKWIEGEQPAMEDGSFTSPLAYDIIQFINGMVKAAETVTGSQRQAQKITCQLPDLLQRFKAFQEDIIKQNKLYSKAYVKAILGCVEQFKDILQRKGHLFPDKVQKNCLAVLTDMKQSGHTFLLSSVHKNLKPQYQKLGTNDWLKKTTLFEKLLNDMEHELQDLEGMTQSCHQEVISRFHEEVTREYVMRLLRGEVKLKDRGHQQKAFITVTKNAESLHDLFNKLGSKKDWLKEILTNIAEVLKLQDIPALQIQIVSMGHAYPDLSERHVSALLKLKTNVSREDRHRVKATLSDARDGSNEGVERLYFFSKVVVK